MTSEEDLRKKVDNLINTLEYRVEGTESPAHPNDIQRMFILRRHLFLDSLIKLILSLISEERKKAAEAYECLFKTLDDKFESHGEMEREEWEELRQKYLGEKEMKDCELDDKVWKIVNSMHNSIEDLHLEIKTLIKEAMQVRTDEMLNKLEMIDKENPNVEEFFLALEDFKTELHKKYLSENQGGYVSVPGFNKPISKEEEQKVNDYIDKKYLSGKDEGE